MLSYNLLRMHVCFCCVGFSFSVLSQEIGWEERLRNDLFCVGVGRKALTRSISHRLVLDMGTDRYRPTAYSTLA